MLTGSHCRGLVLRYIERVASAAKPLYFVRIVRAHLLVCCSVPALLLQQLLLFVIVCRNIVSGSLNVIPSSVLFFFIQNTMCF